MGYGMQPRKKPAAEEPFNPHLGNPGGVGTPRYKGKLRTRTKAQNKRATIGGGLGSAGAAAKKRGTKMTSDFGPGSPHRLRARTNADNAAAKLPKPKQTNKTAAAGSRGTSGSGGSSRSGSGGSSRSGGGSRGGTSASVESSGPATPGRPTGTTPAARGRSKQNTSAGRAAGESTADAQIKDPIKDMFGAARRTLDAEAQKMEAIRQARIADLAKFDEYMKQAREKANGTLQSQFAASAADAASARTAADARVNSLIEQAKGIVQNPDAQAQSGMTAGEQSFGFQQQADGYRSAATAFNQSNLMQRNVERQNEDFARSQDMRSSTENNYNRFLDNLRKERVGLDTEEAKARITQANADRQYALDREAGDFLKDYRQQQLGIEATKAETDRIKVINQANLQRESLKLKAAVEQGRLTLREAEIQARERIAASNVSQKEKDRRTRVAIARIRSGGATASNPAKGAQAGMQKYINEMLAGTYGGKKFTEIDDHGRSNIVRGAVVRLATENPGINARQAWTLMNSVFGGALMESNPQYLRLVNQNFKR